MYKILQIKLQIRHHLKQYEKTKSFYHKQQADNLRYKIDKLKRGESINESR